ncbi:MAG: response regulator transcription factor [Actinomycetota bacterium]|nr:response regulator transcription factor [Actinomycetota bacterium]
MDRRTHAVIVDELAIARAGIASVLRDLGFDELTETHSGRDAAAIAAIDSPALAVVGAVTDISMVETARRVLRVRPAPIVVALVPPAADQPVGYLLALGVRGVVLRGGPTVELGDAVEAAMKGGQFVARGLHRSLAGTVQPREPAVDHGLSAREREVLALLAEGRSNREIASALSVTLATVKSHLVRIYAKLEAKNRNEALGKAVSLGLLG